MAAAAAMIASRKHRNLGSRYGASRGHYSAHDEDGDGPNMCWIVLFGVCGVALIGSGAWYAYDSFEDPRMVAVERYNSVVDDWSSRGREQFASTAFEWRLVSPQAEKVTVQGNCEDEEGTIPPGCTKTHTEDVYKDVDPDKADKVPWTRMVEDLTKHPLASDQNMKGIKDYEPLNWVGTGVLPAHPPGHLEKGQSGVMEWTGSKYKLQLRATKDDKVSVFDVDPIDPLKEVVAAANIKMCRIHHGNNYHDQRCWDRVAISQVCLRLNYTSDGWQAPEGIPRGCAAGTELAFARHCPGAAIGSRGHGMDLDPGCDFSHVNFTVRSMDDPRTKAMAITDGSLNFGNTPHENWVSPPLPPHPHPPFPLAFALSRWLALGVCVCVCVCVEEIVFGVGGEGSGDDGDGRRLILLHTYIHIHRWEASYSLAHIHIHR
jgi:hypothetical protein